MQIRTHVLHKKMMQTFKMGKEFRKKLATLSGGGSTGKEADNIEGGKSSAEKTLKHRLPVLKSH